MIDPAPLQARWEHTELDALARQLPDIIARGLSAERFGDLPRWQAQLGQLPALEPCARHLDRDRVGAEGEASDVDRAALRDALQGLHPWRKGPFELFGVHVDTEWRSDWKWQRLAPHISPLAGRRVLDVGCGNGYHCWRMRGAGAAEVLGIDPSPLFTLQFQALAHYLRDPAVTLLPMGIEDLPADLQAFDTVFSMGVLYHRREPLDHLQALRAALRPGGELVLETLVVEGDDTRCLVPEGRYARMRNVWFIPSSAMLLLWLRKLGWRRVRLADESPTGVQEQRRTDWMRFHSLADFLDPKDHSRTREGHPAPRRAIVLAEAP